MGHCQSNWTNFPALPSIHKGVHKWDIFSIALIDLGSSIFRAEASVTFIQQSTIAINSTSLFTVFWFPQLPDKLDWGQTFAALATRLLCTRGISNVSNVICYLNCFCGPEYQSRNVTKFVSKHWGLDETADILQIFSYVRVQLNMPIHQPMTPKLSAKKLLINSLRPSGEYMRQ